MGVPALAIFIRFLIYYIENPHTARGHVQSLIVGAVLFFAAMLLAALGVIGDLLDAQRTLSQRTFERVRRIELQLGVEPSHYEPGGSRRPRGASRYDRVQRGARGMPGAAEAVPTGNTFDKYGSTNPVVRRLMAGFERTLDAAVRRGRTAVGARRRLRRGRSDRTLGDAARQREGTRDRPRGPQAPGRMGDAPAAEPRVPDAAAGTLPFERRRIRPRRGDRGARARARSGDARSPRWRAWRARICSSRCRTSRCGGC